MFRKVSACVAMLAMTMLVFVALPATAQAAKPAPVVASIAIDQAAPYAVGDVLTFTTTIPRLSGWEYPMVAVACFQDVDGDGVIEHGWPWDDVVYTELAKPGSTFTLGGYSSIWTLRGGGPAECDADIDAYGWKSGVESVRVLATISFNAG